MDVVTQSLQRGDVDGVDPLLQRSGVFEPGKSIDKGEEGGKGLAGAGKCQEKTAIAAAFNTAEADATDTANIISHAVAEARALKFRLCRRSR
jgi:hypothetical protein